MLAIKSPYLFLLVFACLLGVSRVTAQLNSDSILLVSVKDGQKIAQLNEELGKWNNQVSNFTQSAVNRLAKLEKQLWKKLQKTQPLEAASMQKQGDAFYANLREKLSKSPALYVPTIDSLQMASQFMGQFNNITSTQQAAITKLKATTAEMQQQWNIAENLQQQIRNRKEFLQQQLANTPLAKQLKKVKEASYYYQQQLIAYKELLKDKERLLNKTMDLVRQHPLFKKFMDKHSMLAQLFRPPTNELTPQSLAGLQTRQSVAELLSGRLGANLPAVGSPETLLQGSLQSAQTGLNELKKKVNDFGGGSSELEMPDFKPNSQRTKSFWKRLEYSVNVQSQKTNSFLPLTTDFALMAGYKLNDKSTIGIGTAYKLGWGEEGLKKISFTNQGVGVRIFVDIRLKGSFWITGGYEKQYLPAVQEAVRPLNVRVGNWQTSGLIGITKKYRIGKKTSNMQLLWDFLSYRQQPAATALKFRIGYGL